MPKVDDQLGGAAASGTGMGMPAFAAAFAFVAAMKTEQVQAECGLGRRIAVERLLHIPAFHLALTCAPKPRCQHLGMHRPG